MFNVRNEYIEPFGGTFGGDDYEDDSEDRGWENRFMARWNPGDWKDIESTLMNLCPNVPFDANFGNHYVSRMHERMYEELDDINDILGDESLRTVQTVKDQRGHACSISSTHRAGPCLENRPGIPLQHGQGTSLPHL